MKMNKTEDDEIGEEVLNQEEVAQMQGQSEVTTCKIFQNGGHHIHLSHPVSCSVEI